MEPRMINRSEIEQRAEHDHILPQTKSPNPSLS